MMSIILTDWLYTGTVDDVADAKERGYSILGACKDPLHRQHAKAPGSNTEGYTVRALPKDAPEYFYAERNHALYCNLIDAPDIKYIPDIVIKKALKFIDLEIADHRPVLIACNKGISRSPSIAFMWLLKEHMFDLRDFEEDKYLFQTEACPEYDPGLGMEQYVKKFWMELKKDVEEKENL